MSSFPRELNETYWLLADFQSLETLVRSIATNLCVHVNTTEKYHHSTTQGTRNSDSTSTGGAVPSDSAGAKGTTPGGSATAVGTVSSDGTNTVVTTSSQSTRIEATTTSKYIIEHS